MAIPVDNRPSHTPSVPHKITSESPIVLIVQAGFGEASPAAREVHLRQGPGTGKSFLLRQLETPSLRLYEVNLAQFASPSEFMGELARIAAKRDPRRILMINEADTELSGHHIYPLLLALLWDGTVMHQGEHSLGLGLSGILRKRRLTRT
jgi:hypothetical protein